MNTHPLFDHSQPVGMITGHAPRFPSAPGGHEALKRDLDALGARYEETQGKYGGVPEQSLLVYGLPEHHLAALGKKYGQEAVVHAEGGARKLLYTNGPNEGKWHPGLPTHEHWPEGQSAPQDDYTSVPGVGHVRLHFAFDQLHPQPAAGAEAVPPKVAAAPVTKHEVGHGFYQMLKKTERNLGVTDSAVAKTQENAVADEKKLNIPETLHGLYKGLKERTEEFEQYCLSLRKAEQAALQKSVKKAALGDGALADPASEKQVAKNDLGHGGAGAAPAAPLALAERCKYCGESPCDCADVEKYAKGEVPVAKNLGNPAAYGPGGSVMPPMAKAELCKACGMQKAASHDCDELEKFAKARAEISDRVRPTYTSREEAEKINADLKARGKMQNVSSLPEHKRAKLADIMVDPAKKAEVQPAGASPDGPQPQKGKTPDDKKPKQQGTSDGSGDLAKAGLPMPGAGASAAPKAPAAPKLPKLPGPKPPALGAGTPAPAQKAEAWKPKAGGSTRPCPSCGGEGDRVSDTDNYRCRGCKTQFTKPKAGPVKKTVLLPGHRSPDLGQVRASVGQTMDTMLAAPPAGKVGLDPTWSAASKPTGPTPSPFGAPPPAAPLAATVGVAKPQNLTGKAPSVTLPGFKAPPAQARPGAAVPPPAKTDLTTAKKG